MTEHTLLLKALVTNVHLPVLARTQHALRLISESVLRLLQMLYGGCIEFGVGARSLEEGREATDVHLGSKRLGQPRRDKATAAISAQRCPPFHCAAVGLLHLVREASNKRARGLSGAA